MPQKRPLPGSRGQHPIASLTHTPMCPTSRYTPSDHLIHKAPTAFLCAHHLHCRDTPSATPSTCCPELQHGVCQHAPQAPAACALQHTAAAALHRAHNPSAPAPAVPPQHQHHPRATHHGCCCCRVALSHARLLCCLPCRSCCRVRCWAEPYCLRSLCCLVVECYCLDLKRMKGRSSPAELQLLLQPPLATPHIYLHIRTNTALTIPLGPLFCVPDTMLGCDSHVRMCSLCQRAVYNLSTLYINTQQEYVGPMVGLCAWVPADRAGLHYTECLHPLMSGRHSGYSIQAGWCVLW